MKYLWEEIASLFFRPLCPQCQATLPAQTAPGFCPACLSQLQACRRDRFYQRLVTPKPLALFAWGKYDGPLRRAIATCKYHNRPQILRFLGEEVGQTWQNSLEVRPWQAQYPGLTVVPIPLHPKKYRSRGFNQAEELARGFSRVTGVPCRPELLRRVRETKPQIATESRAERLANLEQAFAAVAFPQPLLLCDDIYTSGATIQAAIAACQAVQTVVVGVLVLARAS
ncbi:MAG: ComF family protein [Pseudanabaenaceae cyanobacterium]